MSWRGVCSEPLHPAVSIGEDERGRNQTVCERLNLICEMGGVSRANLPEVGRWRRTCDCRNFSCSVSVRTTASGSPSTPLE